MEFADVMRLIGRWGGTLKYFPGDQDARIGIAEEVGCMCSSIEQVEWLVRRVPKLFTDWPAMQEIRAVLTSKFRPADGIEGYSHVYLDGIPSEREQRTALPAPDPRSPLLPAGEAGAVLAGVLAQSRRM